MRLLRIHTTDNVAPQYFARLSNCSIHVVFLSRRRADNIACKSSTFQAEIQIANIDRHNLPFSQIG